MFNKKLIDLVRKHPNVIADVWDETGTDDGYWINLHKGYRCPSSGSHSVHAYTVNDLIKDFKSVEQCNCKECRS